MSMINVLVCPKVSAFLLPLGAGYRVESCAGCREEIVVCPCCEARAEKASGVRVSEYQCMPCVEKVAPAAALAELGRKVAAAIARERSLGAIHRDPWERN